MQRTYRTPTALWRVVRALSPAELRLIRRHLHGTRLVWLLKALRHMPVYNEALLMPFAIPEGYTVKPLSEFGLR